MWLLVLLVAPVLPGCAVSTTALSPVVLTSIVPVESFDRTDLQCYYGVVW